MSKAKQLSVIVAIGLVISLITVFFSGLIIFDNFAAISFTPPGSSDSQSKEQDCLESPMSNIDQHIQPNVDLGPQVGGLPFDYYGWYQSDNDCGSGSPTVGLLPLIFLLDWLIWSLVVLTVFKIVGYFVDRHAKHVSQNISSSTKSAHKTWLITVGLVLIGGVFGLGFCIYLVNILDDFLLYGLTLSSYTLPLILLVLGTFSILWLINRFVGRVNQTLSKNAILCVLLPIISSAAAIILLFLSSLSNKPTEGSNILGLTLFSGAWTILVYAAWIIAMIVILVRHFIHSKNH